VVSDSAKFRMTSRKDGTEPVVMALTRGIVIVGELAWAVKGRAAPDLTKLRDVSRARHNGENISNLCVNSKPDVLE